jgi:hypothetical protein
MKKTITLISFLLISAVFFGELASRYILGLGDPPLSVAHPKIEYLFKASSNFKRFGNYFKTNAYSMRSDAFPQTRQSNELRLLILGDSVPNGESHTDQSELATEILKEKLSETVPFPVHIGNISAGSWSPPNLLAYIQEFGTFDADIAIIILNKGDLFDFPKFDRLNPMIHPTQKPSSALGELIVRYIFPKIARTFSDRTNNVTTKKRASRDCTQELLELVHTFSSENIPVCIIYHPCKDEFLDNGSFAPKAEYSILENFTNRHGLQLHSFADIYSQYIPKKIRIYRDNFHPNEMGQKLMADHILKILEKNGFMLQWNLRDESAGLLPKY